MNALRYAALVGGTTEIAAVPPIAARDRLGSTTVDFTVEFGWDEALNLTAAAMRRIARPQAIAF